MLNQNQPVLRHAKCARGAYQDLHLDPKGRTKGTFDSPDENGLAFERVEYQENSPVRVMRVSLKLYLSAVVQ